MIDNIVKRLIHKRVPEDRIDSSELVVSLKKNTGYKAVFYTDRHNLESVSIVAPPQDPIVVNFVYDNHARLAQMNTLVQKEQQLPIMHVQMQYYDNGMLASRMICSGDNQTCYVYNEQGALLVDQSTGQLDNTMPQGSVNNSEQIKIDCVYSIIDAIAKQSREHKKTKSN